MIRHHRSGGCHTSAVTTDGGAIGDAGDASQSGAAPGDADHLDVPAEALAARLARRVEGLTRQLEARIARIDDLERQLGHLRLDNTRETTPEDNARKAAEYDALMNTLTMRMLRRPREAYAVARRWLLARRH